MIPAEVELSCHYKDNSTLFLQFTAEEWSYPATIKTSQHDTCGRVELTCHYKNKSAPFLQRSGVILPL